MNEKIEKALELLREVLDERIEAFMDCNECSYEEACECEDADTLNIVINYLEELL